jgi:DNA replicative helicase MCM subunit Mcm2 (Cdc46/Mcm family)
LLKEQVDISDVNAVRDIVSESYDSFGYDLNKGEVNQDLLFASSSKDTKDMRARHIWYKVADKDGSVDMTKFMKKLSDDSMFSGTKAQSWFGLWETNGVIKLNKNGTWRLS